MFCFDFFNYRASATTQTKVISRDATDISNKDTKDISNNTYSYNE